MTISQIAQICHEANRAYCIAHNDNSQKHWDDCEQWQRDSAIKGVEFALSNPNVTARDQHNSWLQDKLNNAWTFGPVKDPVLKTHPCFVAYDDLPAFQKTKDVLFLSIVRACSAQD